MSEPSRAGSETEPASAAILKRVLSPLVSKDALPPTGSPEISPEMDLKSMLPAVFTTIGAKVERHIGAWRGVKAKKRKRHPALLLFAEAWPVKATP